jgi:LmbE family N-acetylglucosaminyl deacetylase
MRKNIDNPNAREKDTRRRVLVIAAHPDDEALGCGATMAKHAARGDRVWILILGEGVRARREYRGREGKSLVTALRKNAQKAATLMGAERLILRSFPDNQFDGVSLLKIIYAVEEVTRVFAPNIIYTHHYTDVNVDHRRTLEAVEAVIRPMPAIPIEQVFAFEVPSSTEWSFTRKDVFRPDVFNALEEKFFEKKMEAMQCYKSEMRSFPHPRSPEYLRALAMMRGGQGGVPLAEAFELIYWRRP